MRFPSFALVAGFPLVLVAACGGATTDGSTSSSSGASSSGASSSGASSGSSGGTCTTAPVEGRRACVPGKARAGTPLTLAVDASDGCLGCFTTLTCNVSVKGTEVLLAMESRTCPPPGDQACPAVCLVPQTTCTIPALAAGTYDVKVEGEGARAGILPRQLVVDAAADATSCALPPPNTTIEPIDASKYTTVCGSESDCVLATTGSLCQPCRCPNAAIAKSSADAYESDARARASQCEGDRSGIACAACAPVKAECVFDPPGSFAGVCKVVPGP